MLSVLFLVVGFCALLGLFFSLYACVYQYLCEDNSKEKESQAPFRAEAALPLYQTFQSNTLHTTRSSSSGTPHW